MEKHLKSVDFIFILIGLISSLFIIFGSARLSNNVACVAAGILLLAVNINNFISYFKKQKKQCKEESASAKLKFKGE